MKPLLLLISPIALLLAQPTFHGRELLGRPTGTSITINVAPVNALDLYFEYGTVKGAYPSRTPTVSTPANTPVHVLIDKLTPNTRYYYRMRYREAGSSLYLEAPERFFHTARPRGSTYTFAIQFDPHLDENSDENVYRLSLANMLADEPDFLLDLGDNFMSDKLQPVTENGVHNRIRLLRSFYDLTTHSVPLILNLGNHEGEWGRNLNGTPNNVAVWNTVLRKQYFPNPRPDGFYTGDASVEALVGARESWFAWEWGDALFIVLDPYWNRPVAPELQGDWALTLGRRQYDWLKQTLEQSSAPFKFVFAHNLVGGRDLNGPMRGGIEQARFLEWGGHNLDGSWGFDRARPGWPMPIHQLLVANNVHVFFHGHDHLYAKQDLDGIVYLEGPQPSARNFNLGNRGTDYGYVNGTILGGSGYLRVTVSPTEAKAEYVQTWLPAQENGQRRNRMIADSWTVKPRPTGLRLVSAASYQGGLLAPSSLAAAFATSPIPDGAPVLVQDSGGTQRRAEVVGAAPTQVNFLIPPDTAPGPASVAIASLAGATLVTGVAPGLFAINANGFGPAAATALRLRADGSQTSEPVFRCGSAPGSCTTVPLDLGPASDQLYLSLYGTGLRAGASLPIVTAGTERLEVLYAGPQPAFTGLDQINVRLPRTLAGRGEIPITLVTGGRISNSVMIQIR